MGKRILSLFVAALLAFGMLPTPAYAAVGEQVSDVSQTISSAVQSSIEAISSNQDDAQTREASQVVTVRKDPANWMDLTVNLKTQDGTEVTPDADQVAFDDVNFLLGEDSMTIEEFVSGYGLLEFAGKKGTETTSQTFLFKKAVAGDNLGAAGLSSFTYDELAAEVGVDNPVITVILEPQAEQKITAEVFDENSSPINGAQTQLSAGTVDNESAQDLVQSLGQAYILNRAVLQRIEDGNQDSTQKEGSASIEVDSIVQVGNYYYVTSPQSGNPQDVFTVDAWKLQVFFDEAYTLTVKAWDKKHNLDTVNKINKTAINAVTEASAQTLTYQIPRTGYVTLNLDIDKRSRTTVTETTNGASTVLFSSREDGYNKKTPVITFEGTSNTSNRTVEVKFETPEITKTGQWFPVGWQDYLDHKGANGSYHNAQLTYGVWDEPTGSVERRNPATTNVKNIGISQDNKVLALQVLEFTNQKLGGDRKNPAYVMNALVINGQMVNLPTGWSWEKDDGSTWGIKKRVSGKNQGDIIKEVPTADQPGVAKTTLYDDKGNKQADVTVLMHLTYDSKREVGSSTVQVIFENIQSYLEVNKVNYAPKTFPELRLTTIEDGLTGTVENTINNTTSTASIAVGTTLFPEQKGVATIEPEFGFYVTGFNAKDVQNDQSTYAMQASTDTVTPWETKKIYRMNQDDPSTPAGKNDAAIRGGSGLWRGSIEADPIKYTMRYYLNPDGNGQYVTNEQESFTLQEDTSETPELMAYAASLPADKVFVGWALKKDANQETDVLFQPGQSIARTTYTNLFDDTPTLKDTAVDYSTTPGKAYLNLYPVLADRSSSYLTDYAVQIHYGGRTYQINLSGGIVGSQLTRETVLQLADVQQYINGLSDVALDAAASDAVLTLDDSGSVVFQLYYTPKAQVDLTFTSKYGFEDETSTTEKTISVNPNVVIDTGNVPKPASNENETFIGWSTTSDTDILGAIKFVDQIVTPSANMTYYAVFATKPTITFYNFDGNSWAQAEEFKIDYGTTLENKLTDIQGMHTDDKAPKGYEFKGWSEGHPYESVLIQDQSVSEMLYTQDTVYFAIYNPESVTLVLEGNGGTWENNQTEKSETATYGEAKKPAAPTTPKPGGYVFAGWSTNPTVSVGSPQITVGKDEYGGALATAKSYTYYAVWIQASLTVKLANSQEIVYNGQAQKPALDVTYAGKKLEASEYDSTYTNNTNAGLASVEVTSKDGKKGYATFEIKPKKLSDTDVTAALEAGEHTYTGEAITPAPKVEFNGMTLTANKDYTLSYTKNIDVNEQAQVTVTGIGNYTGERSVTFRINPNTAIQFGKMPEYPFNGGKEPVGFSYIVQDNRGHILVEGEDYTLTGLPSDDSSWRIGEYTLTATGMGNYAGATATVKFNIVAAGGSLGVTVDPAVIDSLEGTPTITVTAPDTSTQLTNADYDLTYKIYSEEDGTYTDVDNLQAEGMYQIIATGKNKYAGVTGTASFIRTHGNAGDLTIELDGQAEKVFTYNGQNHWDAIKSSLKVTLNGTPIDAYTYTISRVGGTGTSQATGDQDTPAEYDMTNAGTYRLTVQGSLNGQAATGTTSFYVNPKDINDSTVSLAVDNSKVTYTGSPASHTFTLKDSAINDTLLKERTRDTQTPVDSNGDANYGINVDGDYFIQPHNHNQHVNVGTYVVTLTGSGNYKGSRTATITIEPKEISVTNNIELSYGYSPSDVDAQTQPLVEQIKGNILDQDKDKVNIVFQVDPGLGVSEEGHNHLHGYLTGEKAANYTLNVSGKVIVKPVDLAGGAVQINPSSSSATFNGSAQPPVLSLTHGSSLLQEGTHYNMTYYYMGKDKPADGVDPTTGTEVEASDIIEVGYYIARATAIENGGYENSIDAHYVIVPADYNDVFVTVKSDARDQVYTGSEITLNYDDLTVSFGSGDEINAFSIYGYADNTNVGTATVTVDVNGIRGVGTFNIVPKTLSDDATIAISSLDAVPYNGSAHTPVPELTYTPAEGTSLSLKEGTDFYLSYRDNVQPGTATVVAHGTGNYTGTRETTFQIDYIPATLSFYTWSEDQSWTLSDQTIEATFGTPMTEEDRTTVESLVSEQSGYTFVGWAENSPVSRPISTDDLLARTDINADTAFYAIYEPNDNISITLDPNGGVYNNETAASSETHSYGDTLNPVAEREGYTFAGWSTDQNAVVGDFTLTVGAQEAHYYAVWVQTALSVSIDDNQAFIYNGQQQRPTFTVTASNGTELSADEYTVHWGGEGINAGTYGFTIEATSGGDLGFGSYVINRKNIADATLSVDAISQRAYNGSVHQPTPSVRDNSINTGLRYNQDFTTAYSNNIKPGEATITIGGIGNYDGTREQKFTINPYIGVLTVAPIPDQVFNSGQPVIPSTLVVYDSYGNVLSEDDYTVAYANNTAIGSAEVTVTGKGDLYDAKATGQGVFQIVGTTDAGSALKVVINPAQLPVGNEDPTVAAQLGNTATDLPADQYALSYEVYDAEKGGWSSATALTDIATQLDSAGMYRVIATGLGDISGTSGAAIFVRTPALTGEGELGDWQLSGLTAENLALTYNGQNQISALRNLAVVDGEGAPVDAQNYTVSIAYNNGEATSVTKNGDDYDYDMINAGVYSVTLQGTGSFSGSSVSISVYVAPKSINSTDVSVAGLNGHTYGTDSFTAPTLTVADGAEALSANTDYTVAGLDAITADSDAQTYLVTITGVGNYTDTRTASYVVTPKSVDVTANLELDFGYSDVDTSELEAQAAAAFKEGDNVQASFYVPLGLAEGEHTDALQGFLAGTDSRNYSLNLSGTVTVGKASINDGTSGVDDPNNIFTVNAYPASGSYSGVAHNPTIVVTHNGQRLVEGTDFSVVGYTNAAGEPVDSMVDVGVYTINLQGQGSYDGTFTTRYEITALSNSMSLLVEPIVDQVYTGSPIELNADQLTVTFNDQVVDPANYEVVYTDNINAGTARISVIGREGSFKGMAGMATFKILPKSIGTGNTETAPGITVSGVESSYAYTGSVIEPKPVVKDMLRNDGAGVELVENTDYTVSYGPNISGTGSILLQGNGNYGGSVRIQFAIEANTDLTIGGIDPSYTYTGELITPQPTVTDGTGRQLIEGVDYMVSYEDNLNVGTAQITVSGLGVYANALGTASFEIRAKLLNLEVIVEPATAVEGDGVTPTIDVLLDGRTLTNETDYKLTVRRYQDDGTLSLEEPLTNPESQLASTGMYVIMARGTSGTAYEGALGSATFVRVSDGGSLVPSGENLVDGSNVITKTYDGTDHSYLLDDVSLSTPEGEAVSIESIVVSYNGGPQTSFDSSSAIIDAGVYTLTYQGSNSAGTANVVVIISPKNLADDSISLTGLDPDAFVYDMSEQSPEIGVVDVNGTGTVTLTSDDYDVNSTAQINAGSYPVSVVGKGNYIGVRYGTFIINQRDLSIANTFTIPTFTYGYKQPITLEEGVDYVIDGLIGNDSLTAQVVVPVGLGAGEHFLGATLSGESALNYAVGENKLKVIIAPIDPTDPDTDGDGIPDSKDPDASTDPVPGDENGDGVIDPDADTNDDGYIEDGGSDGESDGIIETIGGLRVEMTPTSSVFTGAPHIPALTLIYTAPNADPVQLTEGVDYKVSYLSAEGEPVESMIAVGSYVVQVDMIGNFSGGYHFPYTITPFNDGEPGGVGGGADGDSDGDGVIEDNNGDGVIEFGGFNVRIAPTSGYANGQPHHPGTYVTYTNAAGETYDLVAGTDYVVKYFGPDGVGEFINMINPGNYVVRVIGIGSFANQAFELPYRIISLPIPEEHASLTYVTNGGDEIEPEFVHRGEAVTVAKPGIREAHIFEGWYYDENFQYKAFMGGETLVLESNITLYAKWSLTPIPDKMTTEHVNYLLGREGANGERLIAPNDNITRAEVATLLFRVLSDEVRDQYRTSENGFSDVPGDAWYIETVSTLANMEAIMGNPDGSFAPDRAITRAELVTIMARLDSGFADDGTTYGDVPFDDVVSDHWAYAPMSFASRNGWIMGDDLGNTFRPDDSITRAEAIAIINRMLHRLPESAEDLVKDRPVFADNQDPAMWYYVTIEEAAHNHDFVRKEDGLHESWTELKPNLSW